jgi:translation elongation factor aEF-1 beta
MAIVAITLRIMPSSTDTNLEKIKAELEKRVGHLDAKVHSTDIEPVAFGLKALIAIIVWSEEKAPDLLENAVRGIENVESVEITDVRRVSF